jgi:hypothetical protein
MEGEWVDDNGNRTIVTNINMYPYTSYSVAEYNIKIPFLSRNIYDGNGEYIGEYDRKNGIVRISGDVYYKIYNSQHNSIFSWRNYQFILNKMTKNNEVYGLWDGVNSLNQHVIVGLRKDESTNLKNKVKGYIIVDDRPVDVSGVVDTFSGELIDTIDNVYDFTYVDFKMEIMINNEKIELDKLSIS